VSFGGSATGGNPSTEPCYAAQLNITDSNFYAVHAGLNYAAYAQGVTLAGVSVTNGDYGILTPTDTTGSNMLIVGGRSQFNTSLDQIYIRGFLSNVQISDSLIYVPPGFAGVRIDGPTGSQYHVHDNQFAGGGGTTTGVKVEAGTFGNVHDNLYNTLTVGTDLTGATGFTDRNNKTAAVTTPVIPGTGNLVDAAGPPALSSCGTSPPPATGNNLAGSFTTGTGAPAACTVTQASAFPTSQFCTISPANAAAAGAGAYISAQSPAAFTITQAGTSSAKFNYSCRGT
jgi:hypothetical protein